MTHIQHLSYRSSYYKRRNRHNDMLMRFNYDSHGNSAWNTFTIPTYHKERGALVQDTVEAVTRVFVDVQNTVGLLELPTYENG